MDFNSDAQIRLVQLNRIPDKSLIVRVVLGLSSNMQVRWMGMARLGRLMVWVLVMG